MKQKTSIHKESFIDYVLDTVDTFNSMPKFGKIFVIVCFVFIISRHVQLSQWAVKSWHKD